MIGDLNCVEVHQASHVHFGECLLHPPDGKFFDVENDGLGIARKARPHEDAVHGRRWDFQKGDDDS